ncbi:MAG: hypothetical protein U0168_06000 [Nannocystaceae bacterium]
MTELLALDPDDFTAALRGHGGRAMLWWDHDQVRWSATHGGSRRWPRG